MDDKLTGTCVVETDVPLPNVYANLRATYRIDEMKIGHSRFFPNAKPETVHSLQKASQHRYPGWRFTVRKMADGMRMWRVCPVCRGIECKGVHDGVDYNHAVSAAQYRISAERYAARTAATRVQSVSTGKRISGYDVHAVVDEQPRQSGLLPLGDQRATDFDADGGVNPRRQRLDDDHSF